MIYSKITASLRYAVLGCVLLFILVPVAQAATQSYKIDDSFSGSGGANPYRTVTLDNIFIDPTTTNWIAWHTQTTPHLENGKEWVGGYSNGVVYGMDDYFFLTITDQNGNSSSRVRMDYNDGSANSSGPQAVIFGEAAVAPDVRRQNWSGVETIFNEAGAFNSWFSSRSGGNYSFLFEFYNGSGSYGHPELHMLVNSSAVPLPPALLLFGSGLIGLLSARIRRSSK
jgi:hypothetical protein